MTGAAIAKSSQPPRDDVGRNEPSAAVSANPDDALTRRRDAGLLTWRGPAVMLFTRCGLALVAQGIAAAVLVMLGSSTPWRDAEPWFPVYGTLIDAGCLLMLWHLTRREGIRLRDLLAFERSRFGRDVLVGLALIPVSLLFILGGVYAAGWIVYGEGKPPYVMGGLPLPAALYGLLVFPILWGITEQMTYNGYLAARLKVLCRSTGVAVAIVAFPWSLQHAFMPMTFDADMMTFRVLGSIPHSVFVAYWYLRFRRLLPLAIAHALMDGATVLIPLLGS